MSSLARRHSWECVPGRHCGGWVSGLALTGGPALAAAAPCHHAGVPCAAGDCGSRLSAAGGLLG